MLTRTPCRRGSGRGGVSLLQVAVTLAALAIPFAAALPAYREFRMRALLAEVRQAASSWKSMAAAWYSTHGSWSGASDLAIGWTNPQSRNWEFGPHVYGPEGYPREAWFVATLRTRTAMTGSVMAAPVEEDLPDYALILYGPRDAAPLECGLLVHRDCGNRTGLAPRNRPPDGPVLRLLARGTTTISLGWDPAARAESYRIFYRRAGDQAWSAGSPDLTADTTAWTVTGLTEETGYEFQGVATNQHGSTAGPVLAASTTGSPPAAPELVVTDTTTTSISLSWTVDTRTQWHVLRWRRSSVQSWDGTANLPGNVQSHTVYGLLPATRYTFTLTASNSWGSSDSQPVSASTRQDPELYGVNLVYGWFYWPSGVPLESISMPNSPPRHNAPGDTPFNYAGTWYSFAQVGGQSGPLRLWKTQALGGGGWTQAHPDVYLPPGRWVSDGASPRAYIDPTGRLWFIATDGSSTGYVWAYDISTGTISQVTQFPVCRGYLTGVGRLAAVIVPQGSNGCNRKRLAYTRDGGRTWSHIDLSSQIVYWGIDPVDYGWSFDHPASILGNAVGITLRRFYCCFTNPQYYHLLMILSPDGEPSVNPAAPFYNVSSRWGYFNHGPWGNEIQAHVLRVGGNGEDLYVARNQGSGWSYSSLPYNSRTQSQMFRSAGKDFALGPYGGYCGHDGLYARNNSASNWYDTKVVGCIYPPQVLLVNGGLQVARPWG